LFDVFARSGKNGYVKDLTEKHFEIYDSKQKREIEFFERKNSPISVGVLFDLSASMKSQRGGMNKVSTAVEGFKRFLENANAENEYFVQTFGEENNILSDFTKDRNRIQSVLSKIKETKIKAMKTLFNDALDSGFEKVLSGNYSDKVLIVVSDGMDSDSETKLKQIRHKFRNSGVLVYLVNIITAEDLGNSISSDTYYQIASRSAAERTLRDFDPPNMSGNRVPPSSYITNIKELDEIVSETGGRAFFPVNQKEIAQVFEQIAEELSSRYKIGVKTDETARKNEWRKLEIKLNLSKDEKRKFGKIELRARKGFYF
jgi:VWFA-related protein